MVKALKTDESGMTLIEMLITITILVIISLPLAGILSMGMILPTQAQQRVADTGNAQLFASFFGDDFLQSSTANATGCPSPSGTVVMALHWLDQTTTAPAGLVTKNVDYATSGTDMFRDYCDSTGSTSSVKVLQSLSTVTPPSFSAPCTAAGPTTCTVAITEVGTRSDATPYAFSLSATRRNG